MCGACGGATRALPLNYSMNTGSGAAAAPAAPAFDATAAAAATTSAAQAIAGSSAIGTTAAHAHDAGTGHTQGMVDRSVNGQVANRAKSQDVYDKVRAIVAKYPNVAALRAAGADVKANPKGGDHIALPASEAAFVKSLQDADTKFEWLVIDNAGNVQSAQVTQRGAGSDTPPAWGGVWHQHDTGKPFMTHVYPNASLDQAFQM